MKISSLLGRNGYLLAPFRIFNRRRLASRTAIAEIVTPHTRWNYFLDSYTFKKVKNHYIHSCSHSDYRSPAHPLAGPYWQNALTTACKLWHLVEEEESLLGDSRELAGLQSEMWDTLVFLMQGVYYLSHGCPLTRLKDTDNTMFLLHAATYALPSCVSSTSDSIEEFFGERRRGTGSTFALGVFRKILQNHPDQLFKVGPLWGRGRTPLHIAAANNMLTRFGPFSIIEDPGCSLEIFEEILSRCPSSLARMRDRTGRYPLHLAAASGYTWSLGLDKLFRLAPQVVDDTSLPPLFLILASAASTSTLGTLFEVLKAAPHMLQQRSSVADIDQEQPI